MYYLKGRQYIIRDDEFYKNKLDKIAKLKFKVYRYVKYDKASAALKVWYTEAAGEDQHNLFKFLMHAWGKQDAVPHARSAEVHAVDKGSANQYLGNQELAGCARRGAPDP